MMHITWGMFLTGIGSVGILLFSVLLVISGKGFTSHRRELLKEIEKE